MADIEFTEIEDGKMLHGKDGYPALADFIATDPDGGTFVFRRFGNLTARRLLNLETELTVMEQRQTALEKEAENSKDHELHSSLRDWKTLSRNPNSKDNITARKRLADEINEKLDEYRTSDCSSLLCGNALI